MVEVSKMSELPPGVHNDVLRAAIDKKQQHAIPIKSNERVSLVGMTSSGKTYFARAFLAHSPRLIVVDPKGTQYNHLWDTVPYSENSIKTLQEIDKNGEYTGRARIRITAPISRKEWEYYFAIIYGLRNITVYIDELYGVTPPVAGEWLQALYTRGRELGIGVWAAMQRPVFVPKFVFSEAEWKVMFRLELDDDKEFMARNVFGPIAKEELYNHQFIIKRAGDKSVKKYQELQITHMYK